MSRTSLQNMLALVDVQQSWNWDIFFPRIPGIADTRFLTYKAISTSIPGFTIEQTTWEGHGIKLKYMGRRSWDDTWTFTAIETRDSTTRDALVGWAEFGRSWQKNTGAYKSEYAVPAELSLYDDKGLVSRSFKMVNAWPTTVGQVDLSQSSEIVQYAVTLSFDDVEETNTPAT